MTLITGASGMLGQYIASLLPEKSFLTLGRGTDNDFVYDLRSDTPDFDGRGFKSVVHCAGTESEQDAFALNVEGTRHLLDALSANPPAEFTYISSFRVYPSDAGENVTEDFSLNPDSDAGRSKLEAERLVASWAAQNGVRLTIIRPARMFGTGVGGEMLRLFNDTLSGAYMHVRGNDARLSIVTAIDVATAVVKLRGLPGIFNAADGRNPSWLTLAEAMTANAGTPKRIMQIPPVVAEWMWRLGRWIPSVNRNLNPETMKRRLTTLTLDGSRLSQAAGMEYFDTVSVINHSDSSYPYSE